MFLKMPFLCDQCNKVAFCKIYTIISHQRIHTGGKPFTSDHCNKRFFHKIKSYKTWELTHWEKKHFHVVSVTRLLPWAIILQKHQRLPTGEKLISSNQCDKNYSKRSLLIIHQRIHTGKKPFTCDQCNKSFFKDHIL